jgi:hypothetical protein
VLPHDHIILPDGVLCMWKSADWMTDDAKKLYQLDNFGKVQVTESGMYFIYGQVGTWSVELLKEKRVFP